MPPRPSHLPHVTERSALQRLSGGHELPASALHPAGIVTIAKMVEKEWIELRGTDRYRITHAGAVALKAELPMPIRKRGSKDL